MLLVLFMMFSLSFFFHALRAFCNLLQVKANNRYAGASNWTVKVSYNVPFAPIKKHQ
jgi:hypothetical protein